MDKISYQTIVSEDYIKLTHIMTTAFDEDTQLHTDMETGGPTGYNDGSLIKYLNENDKFESYKIIYDGIIVGAYTIAINSDNEYSLEMLFIDSSYKGHHIGTLVWIDIEQKYENARKWTIETPDYSIRNHNFYTKKCGFTFVKENLCSNGEKSFVFEKVR